MTPPSPPNPPPAPNVGSASSALPPSPIPTPPNSPRSPLPPRDVLPVHPPTRPPDPPKPLIEAINLTFAFHKRPVLRDLSLLCHPGEVVSLLGPNGCGKSTLIKVLLGQLPSAGSVRWDGKDLARWNPKSLARKVAYLPQHPAWSPGHTVLQAILLGRYPHLGLLGLETRHDEETARNAALALGLQADLDRPLESLSGGQRQRVFLARCLAQEPAALLLDEPDTFLDLKHAAALAGTLKRLSRHKNLAVLLASHDLHLAAALADRIILMDDGHIIAQGPPRAVLTPENIQRVYGVKTVPWESPGPTPHWGLGIIY